MKKKFFVLMAIMVMVLFVGCAGNDNGNGDTNVNVNVNTDNSNNGITDGSNSGLNDIIKNVYPLEKGSWQYKIPEGIAIAYLEDKGSGEAKAKLGTRIGNDFYDYEEVRGLYVDPNWTASDGAPLDMEKVFIGFDFNVGYCPEPPRGTGDYPTLWVAYSKRFTRSNPNPKFESPSYYPPENGWQYGIFDRATVNKSGVGAYPEVLDKGNSVKVKMVSFVGSDLKDFDGERGVLIPDGWVPADGDPIGEQWLYIMDGRYAGFYFKDFYKKAYAPEPPDGYKPYETLWTIIF